jgi:hypothetical protein
MHKLHLRRPFGALALVAIAVLALAGTAFAATVVVTQNSSNWQSVDTRPGGTVSFTTEYGAPAGLGSGALKLTTDATTAAKADYWTEDVEGTALAGVTDLAYWTYQAATPQPPVAAPSYQVAVDLNGAADGGFTNLVFEPYWNVTQGPIVPGVWQDWDVDAGQLWSSRTVTAGTCAVVSGAGGPPFYTLAGLQATCPDAVVLAIGVNVGSFNPGYTVATDGVQFNETVSNFEVGRAPVTKDDCKDGGWMTFNDPSFRNQGECVSYANAQDRG